MEGRSRCLAECDGVDRVEHAVGILVHAVSLRISCFEGLLRSENVEESVQIAGGRFDLLKIPFSELKVGAAVERPPVVCVVAGNRRRASR